MNREEVLCSDLDNTDPCNPKHSSLGNQNSGGVSEYGILQEASVNLQDGISRQSCNETFNNEDDNNEDFDVDVMTGSYGEISLDQELLASDGGIFCESKDLQHRKTLSSDQTSELHGCKESKRPNSLVLTKSSKVLSEDGTVLPGSGEDQGSCKRIHKSQQTSDSQTTSLDGSPSLSSEEFAICSPTHRRTGSDTSGLSDLPGTITIDGEMVSFFAEDLQEKIKLSSPISRWTDSPSFPGSRSSTPSLHRQVLQSQAPIIDAGAVADLEAHARKVASCVDTMLENLSGTLQCISSLTVDYMETYETAVCKTCDAVDTSIKTMYQLMAKCEELSKSVQPLYKISQDIKSIKKILDQFENVVEKKS